MTPPPSRALRTRAINLSRVLGPFITVRTSNSINMKYKYILQDVLVCILAEEVYELCLNVNRE